MRGSCAGVGGMGATSPRRQLRGTSQPAMQAPVGVGGLTRAHFFALRVSGPPPR